MRFERTTDAELIRVIVTHPKVYAKVTDDNAPSPEKWRPQMNEAAWYVLVWDEDVILGLWAFFPENSVTWKAHICYLPDAYGVSIEATRDLFRWVFSNTACRRIVGAIPFSNKLALRMAAGAGCKPFGIDEGSFLKDGRLQDRVMMGISA